MRNRLSPWKRTGFLFLGFLLLVFLLCVFRTAVFAGIGNFLVVRDRLEPADVIYVLDGDPMVRPNQAASLFRKGIASTIVIARQGDSPGVLAGAYPNPTDTNIYMLQHLGVPAERIVELRPPGGVEHTVDEAKALLNYSREHPLHTVAVVTSDLHSRRARFIFNRVFTGRGVKFILTPVPDLKYGAANWWTKEDGVIGCQNEYLKLLYYHLKY